MFGRPKKRMKTFLLSLACAVGFTATAQAQLFRPQIANDVLIGGVAGALIGDHNHHRALEGAAIGAAAGYLWGVATTPREQPAYAPPVPVVAGYGYGYAPEPVYVEAPLVVSAWGPRYGGYGNYHRPVHYVGYYGRAHSYWNYGFRGGRGYSYWQHGYGRRR